MNLIVFVPQLYADLRSPGVLYGIIHQLLYYPVNIHRFIFVNAAIVRGHNNKSHLTLLVQETHIFAQCLHKAFSQQDVGHQVEGNFTHSFQNSINMAIGFFKLRKVIRVGKHKTVDSHSHC